MQQVRAAVRQMPVLPSERYLRYLRLTGRRRELTALAVWLAGRPDIIPTFSEHDPSEPEQTFSSSPENSCEMKTEHANPSSSVFERGSSASFSSGNDEVPEKRTVLRENAPSQVAAGEGEEASEVGKQGDGGGVQGSCSDIFPRQSPCLPAENRGGAVASLDRRDGSQEALRDEIATAANLRNGWKTTDMDTGGGTISLSTSEQLSADLLPTMKTNLVPRDLPADPESHKVGSNAPVNPAQDQLILPTATAGAKAKAKKQPTVKNPPPRLAHVAQKAMARSKISRPLGQAQWQAPGMPGEVPAARDPQRVAKTQHPRHSSVVAADTVKCQPPESDDNAAAMPLEKGSDISASKAQGSPVKLSSQSDEEPTTVAAAQLPVDTPPRGPRSNFQKKQPLMQSRLVASRAFSSRLFNGPKNGLRRPSAASLPGRRGTTLGVDPTPQPTADPEQLTQEALDLLSEPQMLAEMATLCVRLSDLFCCRSATSSVEQPSGGQAAMERPSEFEQEPT
ncbi:hypothetical protein, conserved [Eimeria tenella]|uniref:Uncharacterized protein n=1 Tax=Eimeria tenella TaxID=5802 RepID=U6KTU3_EIMTE|nr:hypothetical protein, conserved [Eimeria tenella]CDJ41386.1 hypothetical protein, conserved [Eimeria tenella]|eukprot:XP_013232136.1 hypothetical protein, conserved [Eimeria tenella]